MMEKVVLATDLGGTNLRMAAIGREGEILFRTKHETPKSDRAEEIVALISQAAKLCQQGIGDAGQISAIGIAAPATINAAEGVLMKAPNLPALDGFRLSAAIKSDLNLPVVLENDANAAAIGEHWLGASKGFLTSICVMLGTGVGGGIIVDGRILRGVDGSAGEIGHICVEPLGAPCGCGSRGCVEQYSSASAVVRLARNLENQYPNSLILHNTQVTALSIYEAGRKNDELALEVFRQMGFYLGIALADLINVLNPEVIVIGGGASAGWDLFVPQMKDQIQSRAFREPALRAKIVRAQLNDDAGILGAAKLAFEII